MSVAEESAADLARASQNPVADMISLPFQNNTNYNIGPDDDTQNVLNIQPVAPLSLNEDTNLITRTIVPIISQPKLFPGGERENGLGDIQFTAFYSPKKPTAGGLIWGAGPVVLMDTATDKVLGTGKWSAGPSIAGAEDDGRLGDRRVGAERVGFRRRQRSRERQSISDAAVHQLQLSTHPRPLPEFLADHHGELGSQQQGYVDGTDRRSDRTDLPMGQATDQRLGQGVLQRRSRSSDLTGRFAYSGRSCSRRNANDSRRGRTDVRSSKRRAAERHFRSDRVVMARGRWFVVTRERIDVGPYATKLQSGEAQLGQALDGIDDPAIALALSASS
jgi:hypothetical protein